MDVGARSDGDLARLAREGDIDAFVEIVRRYEPRVRAVLIRLLDDTRDVEEAVQDVFVQAWRNVDGYRGDAALFTWLYRIGVNAALARTRRRSLPTVAASEIESGAQASVSDQPEVVVEREDLRGGVLRALAALPLQYREAVILRDLVGLSNAEVADTLGIGIAAAKSRIHRGRLQLHELLRPLLEDERDERIA
ncbi:MAG: DNA-directed RNA polymerase sigma-70 factor [Gaiellaceae bacterium]|nr:MAG: DNA-directed RNA polymerase sigma-70 factor [Gaiellaceae bacterium]